MLIIDFIKQNRNWRTLLVEKPYSLIVKEKDNFALFMYNQLESDFNNPLVRECRGLILDIETLTPVCVPFYKFGNYGESYVPKIDWNTAKVQEKVDGCFTRDDKVLLADGSSLPIGDIVKNKLSLEVLSYNKETGKIEPNKIVGWKVSEKGAPLKQWRTIKLKQIRTSLFGKLSQHCVITPTINHVFFRKGANGKMEEVTADKLVVGDALYTPNFMLTDIEKQVVLGTLLGDGSIVYYQKKYQTMDKGISFHHSRKQKDYVWYKYCLLKELGSIPKDVNIENSFAKEKTKYVSNTHPGITQLYNIVYNNEKKEININWLEELNWLGFAIWYMDDGSYDKSPKNGSINLHTEGFLLEGNELVHNYYENKGYKNYIRHDTRGHFFIHFSTTASEKIWTEIAKYIPNCMQYKLPLRHQGKFEPIIDSGKRQIVLCEGYIEKIDEGLSSHNRYHSNSVLRYDIEVENNHSYFCQGCLVHNSLIKLWNYKDEWHVSTNGTIDAKDAELPTDVSPYKNFYELFEVAKEKVGLNFQCLNKSYTYMFELVSPFNRVVVPYSDIDIYHIGTRHNKTLEELNLNIGIKKPYEYGLSSLAECLEASNKLPFTDEGYVVVDINWNRIKIKSPAYVAAHYLKNNGIVTKARIVEMLRTKQEEEFLNYYPEYKDAFMEVVGLIHNLRVEMTSTLYEIMDIQSRKEFALIATRTKCPAFLFGWLDGKVKDFDEWLSKQRVEKIVEIIERK